MEPGLHHRRNALINLLSFSLNRLERLRSADIARRYAEFIRLSRFHKP